MDVQLSGCPTLPPHSPEGTLISLIAYGPCVWPAVCLNEVHADLKKKKKKPTFSSSFSLTDKGLFHCNISSAILFSHAPSGTSEFSYIILDFPLITLSSQRTSSLNKKKTSACHFSFSFTFLFSNSFSHADSLEG